MFTEITDVKNKGCPYMATFVFIFIGYPDFRREIEVITLYPADSIFSLKL